MHIDLLAPDEPLSPELVLVFPPELRAQALARLPAPDWQTRPAPDWQTRRPRLAEVPAPPADEPFAGSFAAMVIARVTQLALIFAAVTILTLALSLVAHAMR